MLKAVLFDMDGVLVDSEKLHCKAAVIAFQELSIPADYDYCLKFVGTTSKKMMDIVIKEHNLSYSNQELLHAYHKSKEKLLSSEGYESIPYTKELLQTLHKEGYLLAIASSSPIEDINYVVETFGINEYFTKLISGSNIPNPKPAPDIYLLTADELGVLADECIVIEDSTHGVNAGKSANMPVIGFINKNSGNQDLSKADILIEGFEGIGLRFLNDVYHRFHNQPIIVYEDNRMIIREFSPDDLDDLYTMLTELSTSNQTYENELQQNNLTQKDFKDKHLSYIKNTYPYYGYGLWGVFDKEYNQLIGRCGIQSNHLDNTDIIELGYEIRPSYQNKGYGYKACNIIIDYAFNYLYIDKITCKIHPSNLQSQNLANKLGMKKVSTYENNYIYSISKNQ